jgi:hypothetical protein
MLLSVFTALKILIFKDLRQQRLYDLTMNIGQAIASALVLEGQFFVINAHQVHNGCLKIVDMHRVFLDVIAKIVGLTKHKTLFHPGSCHPNRVAARVMVAAIIVAGEFAL